jgi:hypothetical protein
MIFIINGSNGVGKDTFVKFFRKYSKKPVANISSVSGVKKLAKTMGWDGEKTDKSRKFLSNLKDVWTQFNNGPFNFVIDEVEYYQERYKECYTFLHVREPKEIQKLVDKYGSLCYTLLIKRDKEVANNHADLQVNDYEYNIEFDNNYDIKTFENDVKSFVEVIEKVEKGEIEMRPRHKKPYIVSNKAMCNLCSDIIESKHRHDFVTCKCGNSSTDGGLDYFHRSGSLTDMSEFEYRFEEE